MMTIEQKLAIITTMENAEGWDTDYPLPSLSKTVAVVNQLEEGASEVLIDGLTSEQLSYFVEQLEAYKLFTIRVETWRENHLRLYLKGVNTIEELAGIQQVKNKLECACEQLNDATSALGDILANEQLVIINAENFFLANNIEDIRKALNKTITKLARYNEALETNKEEIDKYIFKSKTKN
ncbi:hypothetical protein LP083-2_011 [Listeria phage LP-083-2]|uniref:Uncharacterized protein n=3 Tax=Pecentumvirus TaxID=1857844 RepID=A0A059T6Q1_9CAUD|nr:hypothetical protein LP083-2_011 [Listeria phage LP-083-2]YP_009784633.1 hypothetical protein QLX40_gp121 [Listeria phage LP-124]AHL19219.1 hypothetical protein LP083-2_011 [Listeria phage LP-083-2]AHL19518.1 hypothetical protein LP124_121 [Listeria phage LP-124]QDK05035.2 hypothetical protein FK486_0188 [Listeria phage LP-066]